MDSQLKKKSRRKFLLDLAISFLCLFVLLFVQACRKKIPAPTEEIEPKKEEPIKLAKAVLRSTLAGRWYPADAGVLSNQIAGFFQKAEVKPTNNVIAFILPHAGYQFSGQTAALGLKTITKKYKRVVIIGPSHRVPMEEILSVPRVTHYETPLGQIPLDVEFIDKLLEYSVFQNVPHTHKYEHSVQIEVPLLQYNMKDFKLVPIVAGRCSFETISKAGTILKSLVDNETLVIASSDFVHYGRNYSYIPFAENIPEQIKELDMGAYEHIARLDSNGFLEYKQRTGATICGYVPVAILLSMLGKGTEANLMNYATSGALMGDFSSSVSYLSVAFSGTWGNCPEIKPQTSYHELSEEDKNQLLTLARKSLVHFLENRRVPQASEFGITISDAMKCPRAAFVTLKKLPAFENSEFEGRESKQSHLKDSRLRGCIGDIFPQRPLYKSVITNAINAGVNDRRFLPVTEAECNDITIDISALTAPKPIASPDDIRIGVDGVVLKKNGHSAVFLPQVAPEQGWDVDQMLTRLSLKAGLGADAWKEGANFLVFQAVVFGEDER
ncbi:MAG: AmmeMemoRadiSam system protein B [Planctomycetota bacterium]|jgi:AmmeMemoRadiSam system protein B/AmmeMemoRadiSam system protein A